MSGLNFRDLHLALDEVVDGAREFSDQVAERMRAVYVTPAGRAATVAAESGLPEFPTGEVSTADTLSVAGGKVATWWSSSNVTCPAPGSRSST